MEEWFLPGTRPDGLIHRVVQYKATPEADSAAAGQGQGQADGMRPVRGSRAGSVLGSLAGRPGSTSIAGKPGSRAGSAVLGGGGTGLLRQASMPAHRRSTVVVGMGEHEQEVASIREKFSRHGLTAEQQPDGAAVNAGAGTAAAGAGAGAKPAVGAPVKPSADVPLVLERSFDLITGQTQVVMEAPLSAAACVDGGAEAGTVTRTYGEQWLGQIPLPGRSSWALSSPSMCTHLSPCACSYSPSHPPSLPSCRHRWRPLERYWRGPHSGGGAARACGPLAGLPRRPSSCAGI